VVYYIENTVNGVLNKGQLAKAVYALGIRVPEFKKIQDQFGVPPLWDRPAGFDTLLYIILEQQVSLSSAKAAFEKLLNRLGTINPQNFLNLTDQQLKETGFSRQKINYGRVLAKEVMDGRLRLEELQEMPDHETKKKLMAIKGIGHWTSDIYLLMVLLRPDIWPHGDRALAVAAYEVFRLKTIPDYTELQNMAENWKPWRAAAARLLWHHYLSTSRKKK
jgi:DNA-3-methyladenine glycosylase II